MAALQGADFTQNDQRIVWKYLEKKAQNLEMFGMDLEKRAEPEVPPREEASRRARSLCLVPWTARAVQTQTVSQLAPAAGELQSAIDRLT
ncbi:MAG: hypothetical protein ACLPSW_20165 [Roseiarcus sp.]